MESVILSSASSDERLATLLNEAGVGSEASVLKRLTDDVPLSQSLANLKHLIEKSIQLDLAHIFLDSSELEDILRLVRAGSQPQIANLLAGTYATNNLKTLRKDYCAFTGLLQVHRPYSNSQHSRFLLWIILQAWARCRDHGVQIDENVDKIIKAIFSNHQKRIWEKLDCVFEEIEASQTGKALVS